ncbi:MAG: Radical domain protein [Herbinix sp.]|jgi:MoaA/NifB/PqqE/SkfB family radical SAM enzyme|nr:Radical domain protein [Herbinix sp.]
MYSEFKLEAYLTNGIDKIVKSAFKASLKNLKECLYIAKFTLDCKRAAVIRKNYLKKGKHIPAFLICSITKSCNLHCKGCYDRENNLRQEQRGKEILSVTEWRRIFHEASQIGISFILVAGGEPFIRKEVIEAAADYKKIMFPIFTNGTLFDENYFKLFYKNRNLLPVLSIEGEEEFTDARRGVGIYSNLLHTMEKMKEKGIFFGVSITVTRENLLNVTNDSFLSEIYQRGCKAAIFVEHVPVDQSTKDLTLSEKNREELDRKLRRLRLQYMDMIIVSFPGDEKTSGGCIAAGRGFFHINANGNAEPCPFSPYSDTNIRECTLVGALNSPLFKKLASNDLLLREHQGGCVLFEQEEEVKKIISGN